MASGFYSNGIKALINGTVDWGTSTIKAQLTKNTYTPDFEVNDFLDDVSTHKANGTTDQTIGSCVVNIDTTNNEVEIDGPASSTWTAVSGGETLTGCVIYYDSGTPATSNLICWNEFSASIVSNGSDIQVTWAADGHGKFSY